MTAVSHGTLNSYTNHRCRCAECRAANASYGRRWRKENRGLCPEGRHGTEGSYTNYSCRCVDCTEAHRLYRARQRESR